MKDDLKNKWLAWLRNELEEQLQEVIKMKPQPLSLKEIDKDKIIEEAIKEILNNAIDTFKQEIKQRIKSACEFYLEYKDDPNKLIKDFPYLKNQSIDGFPEDTVEEVAKIKGYDIDVYLMQYNEWLFKFAFKEILEDDKP